MKICVREAFISDEYRQQYDLHLTEKELCDLPDGAHADKVDATVIIEKTDGKVVCTLDINASLSVVCSRCLDEFELPFSSHSVKPVRTEDKGDYEEAVYTDSGMCFNAADEIRTQIYFEFPTKPLCSDDCRGLCPVCGCDLNKSKCSCDIRTTDPRLAVLKNLFDNN